MSPLLAVALIGSLCIACQWTAWRFRLPAIVLLSLAGLVLGPIANLLDPQALFGANLRTLISMAVAIILFDGGLGLRFRELKEMKRTVIQMVIIGAPLGWGLAAAACHFVAALSWPVSMVFGGILVVTGPTVILPLLRQARLQARAATVLKWEGIVNDPLGALFAVLAFEYWDSPVLQQTPHVGFAILLVKVIAIGIGSYVLGRLIQYVFERGHVPEFLKPPAVLMVVLLTYALANLLQEEGGLVAVTVLGITLANSGLPGLEDMRRFKEYLSLLLVSLVFILITATLHWQDLMTLDWHSILFIIVLLLIIRPLTILLSTVRTGLTREELLFVGWIAPRGVVCAAVSGLFGPALVQLGYADGAKMVPLAFAIVFATVIGHGFTLRPWGRRLGLISDQTEGLLIIGSNAFTVELAARLKEMNVPVLIVDKNWYDLRLARQLEIPVHYGEILSEDAEFKLELNRFAAVLAATDNAAYNALVAKNFTHEFGYENIYQLAMEAIPENHARASAVTLQIPAILGGLLYDDVMKRLQAGWKIKNVLMTEQYPYSLYREAQGDHMLPLMSLTATGLSVHAGIESQPAESGYTIIVFAAPTDKSDSSNKGTNH